MRRIYQGLRGEGVGGGFLLGAAAVIGLLIWAIRRKKVSAEEVVATADQVGAQAEAVAAAAEQAIASGDTQAVAETAVVAETAAVQAETAAVVADQAATQAESSGDTKKATGLRRSSQLLSTAAHKMRSVAETSKALAKSTGSLPGGGLPKSPAATTTTPAVSRADEMRAAEDAVYSTAWHNLATKAAKALSDDRVVMRIAAGSSESQIYKSYRRAIEILVANPPPHNRVRNGRYVVACEGGAAKKPIWSVIKDLLRVAAEVRGKVVAAGRDPLTSTHTAPASWISTYGTLVKGGLANVPRTRLQPTCNADLEKYLYELKSEPPAWALRGVDLSARLGGRLYDGGGILSLRGRL